MKTVVDVAQALRAIENSYEAFMVQAIHHAGDRLMPGGEAMVARASVASLDEWSEQVAAAEMHHFATCPRLDHTRCRFAEHVSDEDDQEPPLQTLLFWSEQWRAEAGYELGRRPTIATEANFIRGNLDWAWSNLVEWDDFAADIERARVRVENLLMAGIRSERGVPCLYDECRGKRLVRKLEPCRDEDGNKSWRLTKWHCPSCRRSWDDDRYAAMVTAAAEAAKVEEIDGDIWCTVDYAARRVGRPEATIRSWLHRGHIGTVCIIRGRRVRFVRLADVMARHDGWRLPA